MMNESKKQEEFIVMLNGIQKKIITQKDGSFVLDGKVFHPQIEVHGKSFHVHLDNSVYQVEEHNGRVFLNGKEVDFTFKQSLPELHRKSSRKKGEIVIHAVIPGVVVELLVTEGEEVRKEQPLLYLEAMKMRNEIHSPMDGIVSKIMIKQGSQVKKDDPLLLISNEQEGQMKND